MSSQYRSYIYLTGLIKAYHCRRPGRRSGSDSTFCCKLWVSTESLAVFKKNLKTSLFNDCLLRTNCSLIKFCLVLCIVWIHSKKLKYILNWRVQPCVNLFCGSVGSKKSRFGLDVSNRILCSFQRPRFVMSLSHDQVSNVSCDDKCHMPAGSRRCLWGAKVMTTSLRVNSTSTTLEISLEL